MSVSRKRKQLRIEEKVKIIEELQKGAKNCDIVRDYGLCSSSVSTVRKNKDKILNFYSRGRKRMRKPKYEDLDEAVLRWFRQQMALNLPVQVCTKNTVGLYMYRTRDTSFLTLYYQLSQTVH